MNNISLPIYYKDSQIECLRSGNFNRWEFGLNFIDRNVIPSFVSDQRDSGFDGDPTITSFDLRYIDKDKLRKGTVYAIATIPQELSELRVITEVKNGLHFYKIYAQNDIAAKDLTTGEGIYQIYILLSNGDYYYSEIFNLQGISVTGNAVYVCSNPSFDTLTSIFTLRITRTDTNIYADADAAIYLRLDLVDIPVIWFGATYFALVVGTFIDLTWDCSLISTPYNTFNWYNACVGTFGIEVRSHEDNTLMVSEGNYLRITENN